MNNYLPHPAVVCFVRYCNFSFGGFSCLDTDEGPPVTPWGRSYGAAHACLLVPETSCEARNTRLDRGLLTRTVLGDGFPLLG